MENVVGIKNPRVAIVNVGLEEEKGNSLVKETYPMLKECSNINFIGSIEARDIPKGEADVIISFEKLEAARWLEFLKKDGTIITNTQEVEPMPVITGAAAYPENLIEKMQAAGAKVDAKDFLSIAQEAGSAKAVNIALMGRLSTYFPEISDEQWQDAIEKIVPLKFLDLNRKAFEAGRNA